NASRRRACARSRTHARTPSLPLCNRHSGMALARWCVPFVAFALGFAVLRTGLAEHEASGSLSVAAFAAAGIQTAPVRPASATWLTHLPAHVQIPNAQQRFVAAPVGGLVTSVLVGVGEQVRQGQALVELVSPELLALRRELAQATAERERTQQALARDERLLAEGLVPLSRVEASRTADRQAAAALAEKRGLLALAGARPGPAGRSAERR